MKVINKEERLKELVKEKRKILNRMKKNREQLALDRMAKKKINEEIKKIKGKNIFADMSKDDARKRVREDIKGTGVNDIYPKDLEEEFDQLDRMEDSINEKQVVEYIDVTDSMDTVSEKEVEQGEENLVGFSVMDGDGVLDLSDEEPLDE